jgi:two-component sensor histidine kinase
LDERKRSSLEVRVGGKIGPVSTPVAQQLLVGILAALTGVGLRYFLPLTPMQLPVLIASAQKQAEDSQLFAREMAHRLKNALTIVQSIAFQTIGADNPDAHKFAARLRALADANELLSEHIQQPTASITDAIHAALTAFKDERARFSVQSIDACISAQQVVSLTLAIHELATDATKYGSLSGRTGSVAIAVDDADDRWYMTRKESGGPEVHQRDREGFGTRLLRRSGMNTRLEFEPEGLRCTIGIRKIR